MKTMLLNYCQQHQQLAPVNKLVSLTWLLWALRSFRSFTLHYISSLDIRTYFLLAQLDDLLQRSWISSSMAGSARPRVEDVEQPWKRALDENVRYLQENLLLTESIYGYLIQENILTMEMIERVKTSSNTDPGRMIELVNCLKKRSEGCFDKFLDVLHDTDNRFVADKLEQSMPPPDSRQSYYSDEMDLLLQTKDRQIRDLQDKLVAKDRRIKELEKVADKLKSRVDEILVHLQQEMQNRVDRYRNLDTVFDEEQRIMNEMQEAINEKDEQLIEAGEKVAELQSQIDELQQDLECVRKDHKTKAEELNIVLAKERRMKANLGLEEDASEQEVLEHLQKSFHTRSELKKAQDELGKITREKMALDSSIKSLTHEKDSLEFEIRQKELEVKRLRGSHMASALPRRIRDPYARVTRRQTGLSERTKTLPRIDVNALPRLPEPVSVKPSMSNRSNLATARVSTAFTQESHPPMLQRRRTFANIVDRETKYCVICRKNYYLKSECRIHVEPIISGKFSCCGDDAYNAKYVGCKAVNHLYIYFSGIGNEYTFYDDRGRPLDFKV